jgi:hypothetical protein
MWRRPMRTGTLEDEDERFSLASSAFRMDEKDVEFRRDLLTLA